MSLVVRRPGGRAQPLALAVAQLGDAAARLRARGVAWRAQCIEQVGRAWARTESPPVADWLDESAPQTGYSPQMLRWGARETFARWTRDDLCGLVADELGSLAALDEASAAGRLPTLGLVVLAATVPPAGLQSVALTLLAGSAVIVRPARRLLPLVERFLASLEQLAPELAEAVRVCEVEPQDTAGIAALGARVDAVVVHGSDEAVAAWRAAAPPGAPVVGYGHRISAAALGRAALEPGALEGHLEGLALDLCAWDQSGCLSPHVLFVERGGAVSARGLAERLASEALAKLETRLPAAPRSLAEEARRQSFVRSRLFEADAVQSPGGATLLVHDEPGPLEPGCAQRVLLVRPFDGAEALVEHLSAAAPRLQALGIAGVAADDPGSMRSRLAPAGLNYLCLPGQMQRPPVRWRHDGIGSIAPLLR